MSSKDDSSPIPRVSINIHTSTTFHGFKELKRRPKQKRRANGNDHSFPPFHGYKDEVHFLKILTKNDTKRIHVYPPLNTKKRQKKKKDKRRFQHPLSTTFIDDEEEYESDFEEGYEQRRASIEDKVSKGLFLFTKKEEKDIHERADDYSRKISADIYHYVKPGNSGYNMQDSPCQSNMDGFTMEYLLSNKKKRRNYLTDSCYVSSCDFHDPYDNTKMLPTGTRLLRPSGKLVQLVARVLQESPDGLLQVPQIYAALQNKYPYFRYMDQSAINSWRSSVRHALYQKWFKKVKFTVPQICCKGSYWTLNKEFDPPTSKKTPEKLKKDSSGTSSDAYKSTEGQNTYPKKKRKYRKRKNTGICQLQFKPNGELLEITNKDDNKKVWNHNVTNSLQELLKVAKEYGLKISLTATPIQEKTENSLASGNDPVLPILPAATIEQIICCHGVVGDNTSFNSAAHENQNVNLSFFNNVSSMVPSTDCHRVPSRENVTKSGCQEMLGNVQTIVTNSETLFVNEYRDSGDFDEDVGEQDDSDELLSAVSIICDTCNNESIKNEEDSYSGHSESLQEFDLFPCVSDTGNFGCFSLPHLVNDDLQSDTLDHWLSVLQASESRLEETSIDGDQVHDDSLFDMSLMNDDTFFQQCKFFDQMEDMKCGM